MKRAIALVAFIPIIALAQAPKIMFVMHGGAGTITRQNTTPDMEKQYREKLEEALRAGHAILAKGGSSLDAVETSIRILEERSPAPRSSRIRSPRRRCFRDAGRTRDRRSVVLMKKMRLR